MRDYITPGCILVIWCDFTDPAKEKFIVIAATEPSLLFFFINSKANNFSGDTAKQQVLVTPKEYLFLRHDSYIDCSELRSEFAAEHIQQQLQLGTCSVKGHITDNTKAEVIEAVMWSRTLPRRQQAVVLKAFGAIS